MTERRAILTLCMANLFRTRVGVRRPCEKAAKRLYYTLYTVVDAKAETKEKVQPYSIYQRGISSTYASENNSSRASCTRTCVTFLSRITFVSATTKVRWGGTSSGCYR